MREIIIYGGGEFARKMNQFFQNIGVKVNYFCVTKKKGESWLDGIEIIGLEELIGLETSYYIFIAAKSRVSTNAILNILLEKNILRERIYDCHDFIDANIYKLQVDNFVGDKYCTLCNSVVNKFESYGVISDLFNEHHIIGAGLRDNCNCPYCSMGDRERWQYFIIKNYTKILVDNCSVLHFAPEYLIANKIRENIKCDYYECDIVLGRARHKVDITDIQFKDETFDFVIANHILEHVPNENKALQEMRRVLKKDGKIILSFPICTDMSTYEDSQIVTREDCERFYGDSDHVRLYGYDFKERIEKNGFSVEIFSPKDILDDLRIEKYGYIKDDIIMMCKKVSD